MLIAAQVTVPTGRLMLMILLAPVAIFFGILVLMTLFGVPIAIGRILMVTAFAVAVGAFLPLMFLQFKANRTRKKMQDQFPVALDVFVRGLRAGHPIAAALDLLTVEMPDPIGASSASSSTKLPMGRNCATPCRPWRTAGNLRTCTCSSCRSRSRRKRAATSRDPRQSIDRDPRAAFDVSQGPRAFERRTHDGDHVDRPTGLRFRVALPLNSAFYLEVADDPAFLPGFLGLIIAYIIGFIRIRKLVDLKV